MIQAQIPQEGAEKEQGKLENLGGAFVSRQKEGYEPNKTSTVCRQALPRREELMRYEEVPNHAIWGDGKAIEGVCQ